jgi:hypothetical protein
MSGLCLDRRGKEGKRNGRGKGRCSLSRLEDPATQRVTSWANRPDQMTRAKVLSAVIVLSLRSGRRPVGQRNAPTIQACTLFSPPLSHAAATSCNRASPRGLASSAASSSSTRGCRGEPRLASDLGEEGKEEESNVLEEKGNEMEEEYSKGSMSTTPYHTKARGGQEEGKEKDDVWPD